MSGWELFTWINVWILAAGSIGVFVLFLLQLPRMMKRLSHQEDEKDKGPDHPSESEPGKKS